MIEGLEMGCKVVFSQWAMPWRKGDVIEVEYPDKINLVTMKLTRSK